MTIVNDFDAELEAQVADSPVFEVIGSVQLPNLEAAGGFNELQERVRKGNREGGQWLDTAGGLARGLNEGALWSQPGDDTGVYALPKHNAHEMPPAETKAMLDAGMPVPAQDKVINYTGGAYALANDTLRGKSGRNENLSGMVDDPSLPREAWTKRGQSAPQIIADLDSQMSPLSDDVMLYRNVNKHDAFGTEDPGELIGKVIQDKGFMSTSFDQTRYRPLNEVGHPAARLRIRAPKGSRVIYAQPVSAFPDEAEMILDRGTKLAIIGYDPYTGWVDAVIVGDPLTTAVSPSLVADMAGYIADAPTYTGCIIALIPAAADPITAEVAGEPPHVTVVWMGDVSDLQAVEQIVAEAERYADKLTPITVPVKGRDIFDEGADVVLLEPTDSLVAMRDGLLTESPSIAAAHDAVEQYPQWNPHVTLGYEDGGSGYPNTTYDGDAVTFDQLGVWAGDDQYNFPLNGALTAAGGGSYNPGQIRVPKGNGALSGRWTDGAGKLGYGLESALNRSLNRLGPGSDQGEHGIDLNDPAAVGEYRMKRATEILEREGRPSFEQSVDRVTDIWNRTDEEERVGSEHWYDRALDLGQEMVDNPNTDLTLEQAVAIIAHTSTRTKWSANETIARAIADGATTKEEIKAKVEVWIADGTIKTRPTILEDNIPRALLAASMEDPIGRFNQNLGSFGEGANKTRTFAANIMGDRDGVTVDAWMYRVLGQAREVTGEMKNPDGSALSQDIRADQVYESLGEVVRVAAGRLGVDPVVLQAATWVWILKNSKRQDKKKGIPGYILDKETGEAIPYEMGGEQELEDALARNLKASAFDEPEDNELLPEDDVPDYWYAMAEELFGIVPEEYPDPEVPELTAAGGFNPGQRRVEKGNENGGQWVDDAGTIADGLEQHIGPQRAPRSYAQLAEMGGEELSRLVNPGRESDPAIPGVTPGEFIEADTIRVEYLTNCQRTSIAVEMQARGYDVVANGSPRGDGYWAEDGTPEDMALNWRQTREALPDGVAGQVAFGFPHDPSTARELMLQEPIGSRFIIAGSYADGAGHAWNAEVIDTPFGPQLVEIDAQTPDLLESEGGSYLTGATQYAGEGFTDIQYLRVDDKLPADIMWTGGPTTGVPWVQTPEDFAADNEATRANPQQPWEYAAIASGPFTFEQAREIVTAATGKQTSNFGWDAGAEWAVGVLPVTYNNVAWYVNKTTGTPREGTLHPGNGFTPVRVPSDSRFALPPQFEVVGTAVGENLTADGNPDQARVPKGNRLGGRWIDTPNAVLDSLGGWQGETTTNAFVVPPIKGQPPFWTKALEGLTGVDSLFRNVTNPNAPAGINSFTPEQGKALEEYTGKLAAELNAGLRDGSIGMDDPRVAMIASCAFPAPYPLKLYRVILPQHLGGVGNVPDLDGKVIQDGAFLSTSLSDFGAKSAVQHVIPGTGHYEEAIMQVITIPAGTMIIVPYNHTKFVREAEVILMPGTPLAVLDVGKPKPMDSAMSDVPLVMEMQPAVPADELVAAGGFNEAQRRVEKGNREGGQWLDTAGALGDALEGEALKASLQESFDRVTNETLAGTGLHAKISVYHMGGSSPKFEVNGLIYEDGAAPDAEPVGTFERKLNTNWESIHNEHFVLNDKYQGKGIGSKLTKAWEAEYQRRGIPEVTVEANIDVGGYTWARLGFEFQNEASARGAIFFAQDKLGPDSPFMDQLVQMQARVARGETVLPAEIAALGYTEGATMWPGKQAMLGSRWYGVKKIPPLPVTAAADSDPRALQIGQLHDAWVDTARYDSIPVSGRSQYPETEEDVHTHADSDTEYMTALIGILGGGLVAAGGFNEAQRRVEKGNRLGGRWMDDPGALSNELLAQNLDDLYEDGGQQALLEFMLAHPGFDDAAVSASLRGRARDAEDELIRSERNAGIEVERQAAIAAREAATARRDSTSLLPFRSPQEDSRMLLDAVSEPLAKRGLHAEVSIVEDLSDGTGTQHRIDLFNEDGELMGRIERTFWADGTVDNDLFTLNPAYQGQGIGSELTAAMEDMWRANGFTKASVHANIDVGGYTWARLGFEFNGYAETRNATWRIIQRMQDSFNPSPAMKEAEATARGMLADLEAGRRTTIHPAELAALGYTEGATLWPGKQAMLGSQWNGIKQLQPEAVTAAAFADPRPALIDALHRQWVPTARYDSIPVDGLSQYPETEEDVHTHADSEAAFMVPLLAILDGSLLAAGGFNEAQRRVEKGNRHGGEWLDTAGEIAGGLERQIGNAKITIKPPSPYVTVKPSKISARDKQQIADYTAAVEGALQDGPLAGMPIDVEVEKTRGGLTAGGPPVDQLRIRAKVLNPAGDTALFTLDRRLFPESGEVKNEWMIVSPLPMENGVIPQGHGIGSAITAATDDALRDMGYTTVRTSAGLNLGGYVWAKQGFAFDNKNGDSNAAGAAGRVLGAAIGTPYQDQAQSLLAKIMAGEDVLPAELAMVGWTEGAETWPGKEGLMGGWWNGVKDLNAPITASALPADVAAYWHGWALTDPAAVDTDSDEFLRGLVDLLGDPLTAAGGFDKGQRRVAKGNEHGGEWMDSAAGVVALLERVDWQFDKPNEVKAAFDKSDPNELRRIANNLISGSASDHNDRAKRNEQADILNAAADRMSERKLTESLQKPVPLPPGAHVIKGSPLSPLYGDALIVHGGGDGQSMDAISRFERGLTPEQHAVLAEHLKAAPGGGIYFGGRGTAVSDLDHNEALKGTQPRGWTPGSTFAEVGGAYNDSTRSMSIGDSGRVGTVIHEASHALDYAYGRKLGVNGGQVSLTPEWRTAATAMSKIGTRSYFSRSTNPTGWLSESFAEVGALISEARLHTGGEYPAATAVMDGLGLSGPGAESVAQQLVDTWQSINDRALGVAS